MKYQILTCQNCGDSFKQTAKHHLKYCSLNCRDKDVEKRIAPKYEEAIKLYQSGLGFKLAARQCGLGAMALRARLKKSGLLQKRDRQNAVTMSHPLRKISRTRNWDANQIIIDEYENDIRLIAKQERRHWRDHPVVASWTASKWSKLHPEHRKRRYRDNRDNKTNYWLASKLRTRIYVVLKGLKKSAPTLSLLGCSVDQFKMHLESQFGTQMTWDNYGTHWHIDHIRPCASFDLRQPTEQAKCFHFSNMQPMVATLNLSKNSRYNGVRYRKPWLPPPCPLNSFQK